METLTEVMTDLMIEQDERLIAEAHAGGLTFALQATRAERIILRGDSDANQN